MSDARSLATSLTALGDRALSDLLSARGVTASPGWNDFFDAAEALLAPPLLTRGIAGLDRAEADALGAAIDSGEPVAGVIRERLAARALVDATGRPFRAVAAAWPAGPPSAAPAQPAEAGEPESDAAAAERAFAATAALADILLATVKTPLGRIGSGALGAQDRRRLVESGAARDTDEADELIAIAVRAGLLGDGERAWLVADDGTSWLESATASRWTTVAARLRDALPPALRTDDGGWSDPPSWPAAYPFEPAWPEAARTLRALFERWAVIAPDGTPTAWAREASRGGELDPAALSELLPPEVDRVFLQNDLTAISPGPLAPALDMRLRAMAVRESRAQASTYRFTPDSLSAALTTGETADSLREFLQTLSLTGVPQPLLYEIDRSAARHGRVRVGTDWSGRTRVTSDDADLLRTIAVDQALRPLGLVMDGDTLTSRSGADTVFWMLADARYPVVAIDADGVARHLDRHTSGAAPIGRPAGDPVDHTALIARLRAADTADADAAWLLRELDQAVRERAAIVIAVRMPDGSDREITLEATGIGGGRLRGRDRGADVERTLPVTSIVSVRPAR